MGVIWRIFLKKGKNHFFAHRIENTVNRHREKFFSVEFKCPSELKPLAAWRHHRATRQSTCYTVDSDIFEKLWEDQICWLKEWLRSCRHTTEKQSDHTNGTITSMQHAIWASLYHLSATNQESHHQFCPKGEDSWCFFNRAIAKQLPASAKDHDDKNFCLASIPREKLQYIKNVYKDLASRELLKRCLKRGLHKT